MDELRRLRESVERLRDHATVRIFREARTLGLLSDPFVNALVDALGTISLDEALAALKAEAEKRDAAPPRREHQWEFYVNGSFCTRCGAAIGSGMPCR
jgi:hypothetical protein